MADIPSNYTIITDGTWTLPPEILNDLPNPGLMPGEEYILTMKTQDWSGVSIMVLFNNGPDGSFIAADDNTFNSSRTEVRFIAPSTRMQLVIDTVVEPIKVTCTSSLQRVR